MISTFIYHLDIYSDQFIIIIFLSFIFPLVEKCIFFIKIMLYKRLNLHISRASMPFNIMSSFYEGLEIQIVKKCIND